MSLLFDIFSKVTSSVRINRWILIKQNSILIAGNKNLSSVTLSMGLEKNATEAKILFMA